MRRRVTRGLALGALLVGLARGVAAQTLASPFLTLRSAANTTATRFGGVGGTTTESTAKVTMAQAGRLLNLYVYPATGGGITTGSYAVTLRKNGASTALTVTINSTAVGVCSVASCPAGTWAAVDYSAGDTLDLQTVPSVSPAPNTNPSMQASLQLAANGGSPATHDGIFIVGNDSATSPADGNFCGGGSSGDNTAKCLDATVTLAEFYAPGSATFTAMAVTLDVN